MQRTAMRVTAVIRNLLIDNLSSAPATPQNLYHPGDHRIITTTSTTGAESKPAKRKKQDLEQQALLNGCLGIVSASADSWEIIGDYVADELRNMSSKAPTVGSKNKNTTCTTGHE